MRERQARFICTAFGNYSLSKATTCHSIMLYRLWRKCTFARECLGAGASAPVSEDAALSNGAPPPAPAPPPYDPISFSVVKPVESFNGEIYFSSPWPQVHRDAADTRPLMVPSPLAYITIKHSYSVSSDISFQCLCSMSRQSSLLRRIASCIAAAHHPLHSGPTPGWYHGCT